jgi:hypothetical protein
MWQFSVSLSFRMIYCWVARLMPPSSSLHVMDCWLALIYPYTHRATHHLLPACLSATLAVSAVLYTSPPVHPFMYPPSIHPYITYLHIYHLHNLSNLSNLFIHLPTYLPTYLYTYLFTYLSRHLAVCVSVRPSVRPSIYLFIQPLIYPSKYTSNPSTCSWILRQAPYDGNISWRFWKWIRLMQIKEMQLRGYFKKFPHFIF